VQVVEQCFDLFDVSGDGSISFREFNKLLRAGSTKATIGRKKRVKEVEEKVEILSVSDIKAQIKHEYAKLQPLKSDQKEVASPQSPRKALAYDEMSSPAA